jgi:hypothetical protein
MSVKISFTNYVNYFPYVCVKDVCRGLVIHIKQFSFCFVPTTVLHQPFNDFGNVEDSYHNGLQLSILKDYFYDILFELRRDNYEQRKMETSTLTL